MAEYRKCTDKKANWLKINDHKPRIGQRVIVLRESGQIMDAYYYTHWVGDFCSGRNNGNSVKGVTSWIPYPR